MNNQYRLAALALLLAFVTAASAQRLVVFSVSGGPKLVTPKGNTEIKAYDNLTMESVVNIPYDASLELLDEANKKQYILKSPGRDRISTFVKNNKGGVVQLTQRYFEYMQKQIKNGAKLSARRYSDAATVTREDETYKEEDDWAKEFEEFTQEAREEYEDFREQANKEYADFMEQAWEQFRSSAPIPAPKREEVPPITLPEKERGKTIKGKPIKVEELVPPVIPTPQPVPINFTINTIPDEVVVVDPKLPTVPVLVQDPNISVKPIERLQINPAVRPAPEGKELTFYGTKVFVRFDAEEAAFRVQGLSERSIANAWKSLSAEALNNTLIDCLNIRKQLRLSDWAYLLLLEQVGQTCMGKGTNEATILTAFLFCQSGYKMRIGRTDSHAVVLFGSRHLIYEHPYFVINGENFYPLHSDSNQLSICTLPYPEEQGLSLLLAQEPILSEARTDMRKIASNSKLAMQVTVNVNKNLIDFYSDYPTSQIGENVCSRWAMYANTPLDAQIKEQIYPALKQKLQGKSQRDAVGMLLDFVQWGFVYKYDEDIWGYDRAFFAEETLYYPYADCEDRSILFSRLVRDLVGLQVVLVYYPGHLATAVHFTDPVDGDYLMVDGNRFVVCDPTFFGAPVGKTMTGMDNKKAKAILLD